MHNILTPAAERLTSSFANISKSLANGTISSLDAASLLASTIQESCAACAAAGATNTDGKLDEMKRSFREAMTPWFSESWFMYRALKKPYGYAGDYELFEAIYDRQPKSSGIGEALDLYFLQTDLASAVRGRKDWVREFLVSFLQERRSSPRVFNIACGPCREIREIGRNSVLSFRLWALDFEQAALDYSSAKLQEAGVPLKKLALIKQNILRLSSPWRNVEKFGLFDLIYSVGLYDYLPDTLLLNLLNATKYMLQPDARYMISFMDSTRYDSTEYQWHLDWDFYQRTESACCTLIERAGLEIVSMEREPNGVTMMFITKKRTEEKVTPMVNVSS